jgi:hypothetical protein
VYQETLYQFFTIQWAFLVHLAGKAGALLGLFWYILRGMAGLAHQAHDPTIQHTVIVYQKKLYYFLKNLIGLFWYILQVWPGL